MQLDNKKVLFVLIIITLLALPGVAFGPAVIRVVLVFPLILFLPGYALLSALFPKHSKLCGLERVVLSFGLSIAIVPLIGLILNYTPLGITLLPILISTTILILVSSAVALYRQRKLPAGECFSVTINIRPTNWQRMGKWDKILSASLVLATLSLAGYLIYFTATPNQGERFTEFYILNAEGKAENYPRQVVLGESVELTVGIVNREYVDTSYRVTIRTNGLKNAEMVTGVLANKERREEKIGFVPQDAGEGQKVELWLYKNNESRPYNDSSIHFYLDVTDASPLA